MTVMSDYEKRRGPLGVRRPEPAAGEGENADREVDRAVAGV